MSDRMTDVRGNRAGLRRAAGLAALAALCGWAGRADAAVAYVSGFGSTPLATANPAVVSWTSPNLAVTPGAGTNRVLVVAVTMSLGSTGTFAASATYNGATAAQAVVTTTSGTRGVWLGYFREATLPAGAANLVVTVNSSQSFNGVSVFAGTYSGVDQTTPVTASGQVVGAAATVTLGAAVASNAGGAYVAAVSRFNASTGATLAPATFASRVNDNASAALHATVGDKLTASAASEATSSTQTGSTSAQALAVVSLNPAAGGTIGVANGTDPANTVTAGQTAAIDAFTVQTSAGTATVTGATVTLGNPSALTSVFLYGNAACTGGTQYGTAATPAASVTFSGLSIAASTTAANVWVCGTGGTVGASTPVTAVVASATTSTAGYTVLASTDAAGTLTVTPPPVPGTTTGSLVATVNGCGSVTVSASYTGDTDGDNAVAFSRSPDGVVFTTLAACASVGGGANPRSCTDTTVAASTSYWYRAQFTDPTGGVTGTNPVTTAASVNTGICTTNLILANPGGQPAAGTLTVGAATWSEVGRFSLAASSGTATLDSVAVVNGATAPLSAAGDLTLNLLDAGGTVVYSTGRWDGTRWVFGSIVNPATGLPLTIPTAAVTFRIFATANYGAAAGERFAMAASPANVIAVAPAAATTGTGFTGSAFTTAAPAAVVEGSPTDSASPLVSILNPEKGKVVSGGFLTQIYVFSGNGTAITAVGLTTDGSTPACAANDPTITKDSHAYASAASAMYAKVLSLAAGTYTLRACAKNGTGTPLLSAPVSITVRAAGTGDGNVLVRDDSSQLCSDCHDQRKLMPHTSEAVGGRYGTWSTTCRDCHTPHSTRNLFLVKEQIVPPGVNGYQTEKNVYLATKVGDSNVSGATSPAASSFVNADASGPCQVCHTRTQNPTSGAARWRNTGNADTHFTAAAGTSACTGCHSHAKGFGAGESAGGANCSSCHASIWNAANGATAGIVSRHGIGNLVGTNDKPTDDATVNWGAQAQLGNIPAAQRSCVNMCHDDHVHDAAGVTTHEYDVYGDARTPAARAMTRDAGGNVTAGTPAKTDFAYNATTQAWGGMCASCHQTPVDASRPAVAPAAFSGSGHDGVTTSDGTATYTWSYQLHDGSTFNRNCTKCHASRAEGTTPTAGASGSGTAAVHGTPDPSLLAGTSRPAGSAAGFVCYNCHGSGAAPANGAQGNRSRKDLQTQIAKATTAGQSGHPSNADTVHVSAAEYANAAFGNALGVAAGAGQRHASCLDCHDSHQAKAGTHAVGTNVAGPPLQGGWGAQLSSNPPFWTAPTSANFTKKVIAAGTDLEATLCFKCHSSFYGTLPTSPSASPAFTETDTAKELNPANVGNYATTGTTSWQAGETAGSFHPVLATAGGNLGAVNLANLVTSPVAWSKTARNLMTCTDCHESDLTTDPNGPHGSAARFILRGPNTAWNNTIAVNNANVVAGVFCWNCHSSSYASSRFPGHTNGNHNVACQNCHAAIPHGGPRIGMLNPAAGTNTTNLPAIAGWDGVAPYWNGGASNRLYLVSYPATAATSWQQGNCGCNGTGH